jgi:hypothetical protein
MQKNSRPGVILMATVVVIITSMVVANATQTITTPNAVNIPYSLAAGANSAAITPVTDKPVLVMGCCTNASSEAAGQVSLITLSTGGMVWTGLEPPSGAAITSGASGVGAIHIVFIDFAHKVDIQVASSTTIRVHNGGSGTLAGNVTLIW